MPASELIERTAALVDQYRPAADPELDAELAALVRRLREPVRVAIVGRVKAGKSTLVNALLGQRVAPTDVSECTRLVTWFYYGAPQRMEVVRLDGRVVERQLDVGGRVPAEVGLPIAEVRELRVYLANDVLRDMTLIDTPGLGSVHAEFSAGTEALLAASRETSAATDRADAVVLLLNQVALADEQATLEALREGARDPLSAVRTLGVLGRADQLGDGSRDAFDVAVELAEHHSSLLRDQLSNVVPVSGLLAETASTAALTELDARGLARIAGLSPGQLIKLTWSADRFVAADADVAVEAEARERLLERLALYGVQRGADFVRNGVTGAGPLARELGEISGLKSIRDSLDQLFGAQEHVLKVRSVLAALSRLAYDPRAPRGLRDAVEALRVDPVMHPVAEVEAWQQTSTDAAAGRDPLPDDLHESLRRLVLPGGPAAKLGLDPSAGPEEIQGTAQTAMVRWRTFLNTDASPQQQAVARVALRSCQLIWSANR